MMQIVTARYGECKTHVNETLAAGNSDRLT
jgi:hypothetical protein